MLLSYSTADLIENSESVDVTTGHYFWLSQDQDSLELSPWSDTFYLKTIEEKQFEFNYTTGEIISN